MTREDVMNRAEKIREWFDVLDAMYEDLLSRPEETASAAGFDPDPRRKPCEHRRVWMREKLCLACDNTGWRPLTRLERDEGLGVDPYSAQLSSGVTVVRDESPAARRARDLRQLDASISALERMARIRAGLDVPEGREARAFRVVARKHRTLNKILSGLKILRDSHRDLYEDARGTGAVALALLIPGKIERPSGAYS